MTPKKSYPFVGQNLTQASGSIPETNAGTEQAKRRALDHAPVREQTERLQGILKRMEQVQKELHETAAALEKFLEEKS